MNITREMISAAHGVTMASGDVILSASLIERVYRAMRELEPKPWPKEADAITQAIQYINSSPYNLTKDECITLLKELRGHYEGVDLTKEQSK